VTPGLHFPHAPIPGESALIRHAVALTFGPVASLLMVIHPKVALEVESAASSIRSLSEPD
jgi:hypothetical protein